LYNFQASEVTVNPTCSTGNKAVQAVTICYQVLGYDVKLHPVTMAQFSTIEILVAMSMSRWEFRIVPCLAGGNASATSLKMLVMRFADVQ